MLTRKMIIGMMVVAVLVWINTAAAGTPYYVDANDGNDLWNGLYPEKRPGDNNDGPFKTVLVAIWDSNTNEPRLEPEDILYFLEGTYYTHKSLGCTVGALFSTEATDNQRITLKSYNGETAVITSMKEPNSWTQVPGTEIYSTPLSKQLSYLAGVGRISNCSEDAVPLRLATDYYNEQTYCETAIVDNNDGNGPYTITLTGEPNKLKYDYEPNDICQIWTTNSDVNSGFYRLAEAANKGASQVTLTANPGDSNDTNDVKVEITMCVDANNIDSIITANGQWARNVHEATGGKLYVRTTDGNDPNTHKVEFSEFIYGGSCTIEIQLPNYKPPDDSNGANYLTFEDLTIEGGYYPISISTDNIQIKNCTFRNCYADGIKVGGAEPADYNNPDDPNDTNYWNSEYGLIEDCNFYNFGESGIDITGGDYWIVRDNIIHDGRWTHLGTECLSAGGIMLKNNNISSICERNEIYNLGHAFYIGGQSWGGIVREAVDCVVRNNIIYSLSGGEYAVLFDAAVNCEFSNNLVYDCNVTESLVKMCRSIPNNPNSVNEDCVIRNNIFYDNKTNCAYFEAHNGCMVGMESNYNRFDPNLKFLWRNEDVNLTEWQADGNDTHSITDTPTFVDLANYDFHHAANSPCINAGDPNADYSGQMDMDGQPRVMGSRVDMGPDETPYSVCNVTKEHWYTSIQAAIDDASAGDEIVVYPGTYYETIDFNGKAIMLRSYNPDDPCVVAATIIDANGSGNVVTFDSSEDADSVLRGFTITNGLQGIYCDGASPTISNCVVSGNKAGNNTVSYWKMDDNAPNTTVVDSSGNGYDGTFNDAGGDPNTSAHHTTGKVDGALDFDGDDDYVDFGDITLSGDFGISMWLYPDSLTFAPILGAADMNDYILFFAYPTDMYFTFSGSSCWFQPGHTFTTGEWQHLVVTRDNGTVLVYRNAVAPSDTGTNNNDFVPEYIGMMYDGQLYYDGKIDDVMMFDRALSEDEIDALYNYNSEGGGIHCTNYASPTISNCTFNSNSARYGGGMYNYRASPTVTNCVFYDNTANYDGGAIFNEESDATIINCTFFENDADYGGGMANWNEASLALTNCVFYDNTANYDGGGMYNDRSSSSPAVTNCVFAGNTANDGGGMANENEASPALTNCVFYDNTANYDGGAIFNEESDATIINCTFFENDADYGGGMYTEDSSLPILTNCIFWGNQAGGSGGEIYNCDSSSDPTFSYCNIEGEVNGSKCAGYDSIDGGHNEYDNPDFVDEDDPDGADNKWATSDDGLIPTDNDCVDEGDNDAVPEGITTDIKGDDRIMGTDVDIGAYEYVQ